MSVRPNQQLQPPSGRLSLQAPDQQHEQHAWLRAAAVPIGIGITLITVGGVVAYVTGKALLQGPVTELVKGPVRASTFGALADLLDAKVFPAAKSASR